jgi:hypothetical protein
MKLCKLYKTVTPLTYPPLSVPDHIKSTSGTKELQHCALIKTTAFQNHLHDGKHRVRILDLSATGNDTELVRKFTLREVITEERMPYTSWKWFHEEF